MADSEQPERVNVLWLVKGLGPGGAEHLLLAHAVSGRHDRFRYDVAYALPHKTHLVPDLQRAGVGVLRLPERPGAWPAAIRRLVVTGGYDVVHVHSPMMAAAARLAVRTLRRRPALVATEHNQWSSFHPVTRWANGLTFPLTDHSFAVSDSVLRSIWAPLRPRVEVLVHGVLLDHMQPSPEARLATRAELGLCDSDVLVLTVANMREQKGYPDLLEAAAQVVASCPRAVFAAVGQGPLLDEVGAMRDRIGLRERFHLLGFRSDVAELLAAADVFALSSRWEGFPIAVMEALAVGVPVVSTIVGGLPGAIEDGVQGRLVPVGDPGRLAAALVDVVSDDGRRAAMAEAARERGLSFDGRRAVHRLDDLYAELAVAGGASSAGR